MFTFDLKFITNQSIDMKVPIVLITGVSRGFGLELTREYCRLGWRVFGVFRSKEDGAQLASKFGKAFVPILADLCDDSAVRKIRLSLEEETDYLSLLINNAGIGGSGHFIGETSVNEIKELFDVHCQKSGRNGTSGISRLVLKSCHFKRIKQDIIAANPDCRSATNDCSAL